jgi:hypothetical protein
MDEETAAVAYDFAPFFLRSMWGETALTRAEYQLQANNLEYYEEILSHAEVYGYATEIQARGREVGQYGYDTDYRIIPKVDDTVIESADVDIDREVVEELSAIWAEQVVSTLTEAQSSTTLSAREFATLITKNNDFCGERRAADALGISVGTYRGKKGRINEKQEECRESSLLNRLSKQHESGYKSRGRQLGDLDDREDIVKPSQIFQATVDADTHSFWKQSREDRGDREPETYDEPHWRTAHIKEVDRVFATESENFEHGDGVRIDLDGVGDTGADLHREGENIQSSIYIPQPQATMLFRQLANALEASGTFEREEVSGDEEILEWVRNNAIPGDKLQIIDPDALEIAPVAQARLEE